MKKTIFTAVLSVLLSANAWAMDLSEARAKGLVGETKAGYVAKLSGGGEVAALVQDVNVKRREEYERIAAQKNEAVDVVARLAVNQIVSGLPAGAKYQDAAGKWQIR